MRKAAATTESPNVNRLSLAMLQTSWTEQRSQVQVLLLLLLLLSATS